MLYLGSPYTHKEAAVREQRYLEVERACAIFHGRNVVVYSPIMHWHNCAVRLKLPTHAAPWEIQNYGILARSARFGVLQLDGWRDSTGLKGERDFARSCQIPVLGFELAGDTLIETGLIDISDW